MAETDKKRKSKGVFGGIVVLLILLAAGYSYYWFKVADAAKTSYVDELSKFADEALITPPEVSGFPGKMVFYKSQEQLASDKGTLQITDLKAESWPFPNMAIEIQTGEIRLRSSQWLEGLSFDSFRAVMRATSEQVIFEESALKQRDFEAEVTGSIDISDSDVAIPDLVVSLSNHQDFLTVLVDSGIIEEQAAAFVGFGLSALMNNETGKIDVPVYARNGTINLGPLPILRLPEDHGYQAGDTPPKRAKPPIVER